MAKWTLPEGASPFTAPAQPETVAVEFKRYPEGKDAPLYFHEQVGEGEWEDKTFTVTRGVGGAVFQMSIQMEDETVSFNLFDMVQQIVKGEAPAPEAGDNRPCNTDIFLTHIHQHEDDHFDLRDRIKDWLEGDWDSALEGLPELKL